jgi:Tol biopolymer transport system component
MSYALLLFGIAAVLPGAQAQPIAITSGPGNDTEPAWSPDGRRVVFQREQEGKVELFLLDAANGTVSPLVTGPGVATFPAWSPDGRSIVYTYARLEGTAASGLENGYNLMLVPAEGGTPKRLTSGRWRDYTPTFSPDGQSVYFSSNRGLKRDGMGLFRVSVEGGEPEPVFVRDGDQIGILEPAWSPDGRLLACAYLGGFRANWTLRLLRLQPRVEDLALTESDHPTYSPAWRPDGKVLACTGFRTSDSGWGIYLVELASGASSRMDTGPGNSRSPVWSPDGRELIFENNRTGAYKLYRTQVPAVTFTVASRPRAVPPKPVAKFDFSRLEGTSVPDLSGQGNAATVTGPIDVAEGGLLCGPGHSVAVAQPKGLDFGVGGFSVQATVRVDQHTNKLRMIAVGDYPGNHYGWQLYLNDTNSVCFNSRTPDLIYVGATSDAPLPTGRKVSLAGVRRPGGGVQLYLDGVPQGSTGTGATIPYPAPLQLRVGTHYDGSTPFVGRIYDVTVYQGALSPEDLGGPTLEEFLKP